MDEQILKQRCNALAKEVEERSKHKNPMYYKALENYRWSRIVVALLEGDEPDSEDIAAVCGIKQVRSAQPASLDLSKEIYEGVNVMDILDKYRDTVPNIHDLLKDAVKEAGYVIEGFYIRR